MPSFAKWFTPLAFFTITGVVGWVILRLCQGHLIYTLDDTYIHLALVQKIALGHYGINASEPSAPASSIIWPFLLLPAVSFSWFQYFPLLLNLLFSGLSAFALGAIIDRLPWAQEDKFRWAKESFLSLAFLFVGNLTGLVFIGMEHSLQVFISIVSAYALIEVWEERRVPTWCIAVVAAGPAVRYEMVSVALAIALILAVQKRYRAALFLVIGSSFIPILFSLFLLSQGLSFLPNSVLAKTGAYTDVHRGIVENILTSSLSLLRNFLTDYTQLYEFEILLALIFLTWRSTGSKRLALLGATLIMSLQFFLGRTNWFHRYEIYATLLGCLVVYRVASPLRGVGFVVGMLCFLIPLRLYLPDTFLIPVASRNIYDQQFQMHRFVDDYYKKDIAVNDLGWVSFQLDPSIYVLDLYGLASTEALHQSHRDAAWLSQITHQHRIGFVMIYREWFESIPPDWTQAGMLSFAGIRVTPFSNRVLFYITPDGNKPEILRELTDFSGSLPPGATFQFTPAPGH